MIVLVDGELATVTVNCRHGDGGCIQSKLLC